jgi:hypothetical protein
MWQQLIIAILVPAAAGYLAWSFLSMRWRQKLLDALASRGLLVQFASQHRARIALPGCSNCSAAGDDSAAPVRARQRSMQARNPRKAVKAGIKT